MGKLESSDLDASVVLLKFLWIKAGRNPALFTSESVTLLRLYLVQSYTRFSLEMQETLKNAAALQDELNRVWNEATVEQRRYMAWQFGQSLDSIGLEDPEFNTPQIGQRATEAVVSISCGAPDYAESSLSSGDWVRPRRRWGCW